MFIPSRIDVETLVSCGKAAGAGSAAFAVPKVADQIIKPVTTALRRLLKCIIPSLLPIC
jgi:hypothetical protein